MRTTAFRPVCIGLWDQEERRKIHEAFPDEEEFHDFAKKAIFDAMRQGYTVSDALIEKEKVAAIGRTLYKALLAIMQAHGPGTLASDRIYGEACDALLLAKDFEEVSKW